MKSRMFIMLIIMAVTGYLLYSMLDVGSANNERELQRKREVINRALIQAYALEGRFPSEIDHLTRYGVIIDRTRFIYIYDMIAINIMPSVTILPR